MNIDETVKALRWIASNDEIVFNAEQANIAADQLEQLQIDNAILKSGNKQIIDDYKLCIAERDKLQAENERLKASQHVRCGVASHSEKEIVSGCITLMERLKNEFGEYLDFVGFEPECEEERFSVGFHYNEIIRTLLLSGTSHSGGASTAKKCRELGFDYSKMVEFEIERRE